MKSLVFDSGPLITLAMNNLLWLIKPLKESFHGDFAISGAVKQECIDKPLTSKKYKLEALQILRLVEDGTVRVVFNTRLEDQATRLMNLANSLFSAQKNRIKITHYAEMESIALALSLESSAVVLDEFITRTLVENPIAVKERLEKKLHTAVDVDKIRLEKFRETVKGIRVIRSFELGVISFELGLLKDYYLKLPHPKKTLLEGLLWGIKLNGCSVSEDEIGEILTLEKV